MVNALDPRSSGPGLSPSQGTTLCSWARHFALSTLVYNWVLVIIMLGGTLRWTSIPSGGSRNASNRFM